MKNTVEFQSCNLTGTKQSQKINLSREDYTSLNGFPHGQWIRVKNNIIASNNGGPSPEIKKGDIVYKAGEEVFVHHNTSLDNDYKVIVHIY